MRWFFQYFWKRKLKVRYLRYRSIQDEFSCGSALAKHISSRLMEAKSEVNEAIRRCNELTPGLNLNEIA